MFDENLRLVEARIEALRKAGRLDVGVETIAAERIVETERHLLRREQDTGAETHLLLPELHRQLRMLTLEALRERTIGTRLGPLLRNERSGMVAAQFWAPSHMDEDGRVIEHVQLVRPARPSARPPKRFVKATGTTAARRCKGRLIRGRCRLYPSLPSGGQERV